LSSPERLKITEIFHSLQGEAQFAGFPTVFVRLTGCPLRCHYCDTAYAFHGGEWWTLPDVLARVAEFATHDVCVTGGEPLAQRSCATLLRALCDAGYRVSLETSGALPVDQLDARVIRVVDVKTPGSGEEARNLYAQLQSLQPQLVVAYNAWRRALPGHDAWFITLREGWLSGAHLADGAWDRVHTARLSSHAIVELERLRALSRVTHSGAGSERLFIEAPAWMRERLSRFATDIDWLETFETDGGPSHELQLLMKVPA